MELLKRYRFPLLGGGIGFLLATAIIAFGVLKTLFVLICCALGLFAGYLLQEVYKK